MLRLSALFLGLLGLVGLYFHSTLPVTGRIRPGFFVFYTNLSNLLLAVYQLTLGVSGHDPQCGVFRWLSSAGVALSMTLCIFVTHLIYQWVLVPSAKKSGKGDLLTDKDNAGAAILEAFKDAKGLESVPIGSYRGFSMSLTVENFGKDFILTLKGKMSHRVELGKDARGNLVRIDNALAQMPERYKTVQGRLENVQAQLATAKAELGKPFPQEAELKEKSARLAELNAELNIDDRTPMEQAAENVVAKRPSVLGKLKAPCVHGAGEKKKSHEQEAR